MKYFCSKCGKTTQYNFEMPKFCAFCGQSFANKPASKETEDNRNKFLNELKLKKNINSSELKSAQNSNLEEDEDHQDDTNYQITDFKKIKPSFKVNVYQAKGESFGSLIDNPSSPIEYNQENNILTKTKEEILQEFKKEAGALRSE